MDIYDRASEQEEKARKIALTHRKPELKAVGICYNCDESIAPNACYCDGDCREDHELRERLKNA